MIGDEMDDFRGEIVQISGLAARLETRRDGHLERSGLCGKATSRVALDSSELTACVSIPRGTVCITYAGLTHVRR
jgi:hypothetical protein